MGALEMLRADTDGRGIQGHLPLPSCGQPANLRKLEGTPV